MHLIKRFASASMPQKADHVSFLDSPRVHIYNLGKDAPSAAGVKEARGSANTDSDSSS